MKFFQSLSEADYFPVTDGGESSTEIFKHYGFKTTDSINFDDLGGESVEVELLLIDNEIFLGFIRFASVYLLYKGETSTGNS